MEIKQKLKLQVHRVDQTLLPAQVDSFVGCSLHCALHPLLKFRLETFTENQVENQTKIRTSGENESSAS